MLALTPMVGLKAQDPSATITPNPLEVRGDNVVFKATVTVPAHKSMKDAGTYVLKPELGDTKFPEVRVNSSQYPNAAKQGFTHTFTVSAPFDEDMIGNDLEIEHEYWAGDKKTEYKDMDDIAECCVTTGQLFSMNSQYELMKYEYTPGKSEPLKVVAQFNFPQDISTLSKDAYRAEVKEIGEYLKKYPDAKITVRGYASPEGTYARNTTLSKERAAIAKKWLGTKLQENGYKRYYNESSVRVETTTEDWIGFLELLDDSDLSDAKKKEVRDIVNRDLSPAETEQQISRAVGGVAKIEEILKPLRRSTVVVASNSAIRPGFSKAEIDSIMTVFESGEIPASSLPDIFNDEESLYASQQTNAVSGKLSLLASYYEKYPDDIRTYSDLGVMTLVDNNMIDIIGGDDALAGIGFDRDKWDIDGEIDIDENKIKMKSKYKEEDVNADKTKTKLKIKFDEDVDAETLFLKAYEANSGDFVVLNNLGAYYLGNGDYVGALPYLTKAVAANPKGYGVNYNLGLYYARIGDYSKAVEYFGKSGNSHGMLYNRGLAKLMNGDYSGAKTDLQAFIAQSPETAIAHYVLAIAGARSNDQALMEKHLKHAIALDVRLSDVSQEDLEFRNYHDVESFKKASDDDPKE